MPGASSATFKADHHERIGRIGERREMNPGSHERDIGHFKQRKFLSKRRGIKSNGKPFRRCSEDRVGQPFAGALNIGLLRPHFVHRLLKAAKTYSLDDSPAAPWTFGVKAIERTDL